MMPRNLCGVIPFDSMCIINIGRGGHGAWDMYSFIQKVKNTAGVFGNCFRQFGGEVVQNL